ncbi:hypothetical protein QJU96_04510 [Pasteurella skyensis]|uniref:Uncharacterized protein n=1 Tax=Phocoenobacter skyensis TaxID=97481 RepID=A0AAJ6ND62_9PAST|nr:hypothetical protein [Pasteurella skyensis]MDP8170550.1 hypothetical protein [Pasteurella skyensis]MDP8174623.1 hypothetical protein [Pasteurella skyensis]
MLDSTTSKIIAGLVVHKIFCKPNKELEKRIKEQEEREQQELDREFEKANRISKECDELIAGLKAKGYLKPDPQPDNKEDEGTWKDTLLGFFGLIGMILFLVWLFS